MVTRLLALVPLVGLSLAAAGCYEDRYQCTMDAQCDLGVGGRCEADGYCSSFDLTCSATHYRYETHAAELTDVCYDDRAELANPCAGGQGPALPEGCFANVCARLPACCEIGWLDACVQVAQEECDLACDTRIAITATRSPTTELWDLRWDGSTWQITQRSDLLPPLSWVAPAPGSVEPRLAATTMATLLVGDAMFPIPPGRTYTSITSVSFDRHQVDTIAAGYFVDVTTSGTDLYDLPDGTMRTSTVAGLYLAWGDTNRDSFPDGVATGGNGNVYRFLENADDGMYSRKVVNQTASNLTGGPTPGAPPLRSIDWLDLNGDTRLDLAVFGMSIRVHETAEALRDQPDLELDCSPPTMARACAADPEPDLEQMAFVGAGLPTRDGASLVFAQFPDRKLWRAKQMDATLSATQMPFPNDGCRCIQTCDDTKCPGANCTCTYDCSSCVPVLAIVSRDLDADKKLDLVAIDAKLRIYTAMAAQNFAWGAPTQIPTTITQPFFSIGTSVSGAPR